MKNKKENSNFDVIQNVTDKSKGFLKNTFGALFTAVDKICKKKNAPEVQSNEEIYEITPEPIFIDQEVETYDSSYENKYIMDIEMEEPAPIEIKVTISDNEENSQIEITDEHNDGNDDVNQIISSHLEEQKNEIKLIKEDFNNANIKDKRAVLITGIHHFLNKTINIDIESLSLEDKNLETMCTTIILNNRLRSLRQILRRENKDISYYDSDSKCNIDEIVEDAEHQIKLLKQEFVIEFYYDMDRYPESDDIMSAFSSIEYQINSKKREVAVDFETTLETNQIKMIVADLDGTLLNSDRKITDTTRDYLSELKNKGYIITIATGRMYALALHALEDLEFVNYIITDNGACTYDALTKELIFKNTIDKELVSRCFDYYNDDCRYIHVCDKNTIYMYSDEEAKLSFAKTIKDKELILHESGDVGHIAMAMKTNEDTIDVYYQLKNDIPELDILIMHDSFKDDKWIDIMNKNCDKSFAVNELANYLNIHDDEIIVFGDGTNDIDMLEKCGYGVAIKNALPEVKEKADAITDYDRNNDGVVRFLEEYLNEA